MSAFVTVAEVEARYRPLTTEERERAEVLLSDISDLLRDEADKAGKDLDAMAEAKPAYLTKVKIVVGDVLMRFLRQSMDGEPISQETESANGFSWSGTYAFPYGGVASALMRNDLKSLGLAKKSRLGVVSLWDGSRE